jgi:UDP-N-acetyl-D-mannosaminuronic acid dehydrogenase
MGLPLGIAFAQTGARVTLLDQDSDRVRTVMTGRMPFIEVAADGALIAALQDHTLRATCNAQVLTDQDVIIVAIGTPIDEFLNPDLSRFHASCDQVLAHLRDDQLLILRSTVCPGTTERLAAQARAQHSQISVAYCPERVTQGNALAELRQHPQIVGGTTPLASRRAAQLFRRFGVSIVELSPLEAEVGKLFTNAYRYLNFAIANQFYQIAGRHGVDFGRVYAGITHDYPRMAGFPQAGLAAGPCLLKDTAQLAAFDFGSFPLGQVAIAINEGFPKLLVDQAKRQFELAPLTAGILGMTFKTESDDARGSLAFKLRKLLRLECRQVLCTDPYLKDSQLVSLERVLAESDILFVGACHAQYRELTFSQPVVDCFGFINRPQTANPARRAA